MATEKMMILKMLEEGKINAEDAARLLASAEGGGPAITAPASHGNQTPPRPAAPGHPAAPTHGASADGPRPNSPAPTKTVGSTIDDMGRKFGAFMKEMEPKLQKMTETVVEKTASAADSISKSLSSHGEKKSSTGGQTSGHFPSAPAAARPTKTMGGASGIEEMIEIRVTQAGAELNLAGLNGQVLVKGYNGDKINAKIFTVAKRPGARVELATLGNKYYLAFDENDFERVCIDAFVPETMFDNMRVATTNGDIRIATIAATNVMVENMNGSTEIVGVSAKTIVAESNNGHLRLADTKADRASVENFNGGISISKIDIASLKTTTFNGPIDMQIADFAAHDYYNWHVETSNGKLGVILPSYATMGYHIKAHAALDNVKLGLVGMNYLRNDKSFVEAKSINYDAAVKKADMTLVTSNAPLVVN
ncbi:MAG: DUF4097 domain-containing protein [Defluviitaleaceae bacterium]|nr:DUF4097 domain-containing protein [Defluviitaleaceae bacterium]